MRCTISIKHFDAKLKFQRWLACKSFPFFIKLKNSNKWRCFRTLKKKKEIITMTALKVLLLSNSSSSTWFMRMPNGWRRRRRWLPLDSKLHHNRMSSGLSGVVKHVNMSLTRWTFPCTSCLVLQYLLPVDIFPLPGLFLPSSQMPDTVCWAYSLADSKP